MDRQTRLETYEVGGAPWTLKFFRPQFPNSCKIRLIQLLKLLNDTTHDLVGTGY